MNHVAQLVRDCHLNIGVDLAIKPKFTIRTFPTCAYALLITPLALALLRIIGKFETSFKKDLEFISQEDIFVIIFIA